MPKSVIFPYGIKLREGGTLDLFPAAEVGFWSQDGQWLTLILVVDSGATISVLPKTDSSVFGIDAVKGKPIAITGISSETLSGWQHTVNAKFGANVIRLPVVFLDHDSAPRVLGRAGVFNRFAVVFDEKNRRTGLLAAGTKEYRTIRKALDALS